MTRYEEPKCTLFEKIIIVVFAIAITVFFAIGIDSALDKTAKFERATLDAQITPEQRADVIGRGK